MKNQHTPAYPVHGVYENTHHGLTKREYFAARAMQGLLMEPNQGSVSTKHVLKILGIDENTEYDYLVHYPQYLAKLSIVYADELLKQL